MTVSIKLRLGGHKVIGIDTDPDMVILSKKLNQILQGNAVFFNDSIRNHQVKAKHELVFSHGFLEYYQDAKISELLIHELLLADTVIIPVPSDSFNKFPVTEGLVRTLGDERFLSFNKWLQLITQSGAKVVESFRLPCGVWNYFFVFTIQRI